MGKGSKRRPTVVSDKQFQDNWEKAFGKKEPKTKEKTSILHLTMKALGVKIWG